MFQKTQQGVIVVVPIGRQGCCRGIFGIGKLDDDFAALNPIGVPILLAAVGFIPGITVGDAAGGDAGHVAAVESAGTGNIRSADVNEPVVIHMQGGYAVPGVVHDFSAAVEIGGKNVFLGVSQVFHDDVFHLMRLSVAAPGVGIIGTVEIHSVEIGASGSRDSVVAAVVSAVRIVIWVNPDFQVVHQVGDARVDSILAEQSVNQPQHQHETDRFVAMHGGDILHFRLCFVNADVVRNFGKEDFPAAHCGAGVNYLAERGIAGLKVIHHRHIGIVGGIVIPVACDLAHVTHLVLIQRRGTGQQLRFVTQALKDFPFRIIGISPDGVAAHVVNGDDVGQVADFRAVADPELEIVLSPLPCQNRQGEQNQNSY